MDAFLRLLRYASPHRAVIAGAVVAMIVYGASTAALAWLIQPIIDDVLATGGTAAATIKLIRQLGGIDRDRLGDQPGGRGRPFARPVGQHHEHAGGQQAGQRQFIRRIGCCVNSICLRFSSELCLRQQGQRPRCR